MYALSIRILLFLWIVPFQSEEFSPTVEKNLLSDCIIDTKQIKIPGYRNAFNPSIIPYKDGYLLSFRIREHLPHQNNKPRVDASFLGIAKLDKEFNLQKKSVQLLNISSYDSKFSFNAEDGRLFKVGDRIFLIFNDLHPLEAMDGFAMYLAELVEEKDFFTLRDQAMPLRYSSSIPIEKNWIPFVVGNQVYLIYSDQPRVLLELDINTGDCRELLRADSGDLWEFGRIRGGSPACLVGDWYMTFFHTRYIETKPDGKEYLNYIMGAYAFEPYFPFSIQSITPAPIGKHAFYTENNSRKVVYPCGMVVEGDQIYVAWGKSDNSTFVTTIDKNKLIALMKRL